MDFLNNSTGFTFTRLHARITEEEGAFFVSVRMLIHSYPPEKGIGNDPTDQQMYIRQRAN